MRFEKRCINAPDGPQPAHGHSQAIYIRGAERVLFISGQIPVDESREVPDAFPDQARLAWRNLEAQLHSANMTLDDLAKVTIILADRSHALNNRSIRKEILGERKPALTIIVAGLLDPNWLIEIEAIAIT